MVNVPFPEDQARAEALAHAVGVPVADITYLHSQPVPGMPEVSWPGHKVRVCAGVNGYWDAVTGRRSYSLAELLGQIPPHRCDGLCGCRS